MFLTSQTALAQGPPAPAPQTSPKQDVPPTPEGGGFVPGQKRPPGDPAQIARGKTLFGINCRGCHGADLRGGDLGGPNLLRSQIALSDRDGELIVPIIQGSRTNMGMPAIGVSPADAKAVAAYVRSVVEMIQGQGAPPSLGRTAPSVVIGNAAEGKVFFNANCAGCHSPTGDFATIAARFPDPKRLQNAWVAGGTEESWNRPASDPANPRVPSATVTLPSGETVDGKVIQIDDFLVTILLPDGTERTIRRTGATKVVVRDPMEKHRDLLSQYSNKDVHDVTAYLVTLK